MNIPEKLISLKPYDSGGLSPDIKLDANESFITPSREILDKINDAVNAVDLRRYPDPAAGELCARAAEIYGVSNECITASNGSDEMISILFNSFLSKGERVLVSAPDFSMYSFYAHLAELQVVSADKNNLTIDIDDIIRIAKENSVSAIILSNPCNPTGTGAKRQDILKLILSVDCLVIIDEAYMEFWDESVIGDVTRFPNAIVLRTCSKAFGLAAARLGFAISNKEIADYIKAAKSPFNVNSLSQAAGSVLLSETGYLRDCIEQIKSSKDLLFKILSELAEEYPGLISASDTVANFVLLKSTIAERLYDSLAANGVLVRRLMGDYLRITAGSHEENMKVTCCIREQLEKEGNEGR